MKREGNDAERARVDETRRRARIVRRYVALDRPSAEDDRSHAEELGLSVDSLLRLAQSWRLHGRAEVLRGGRVRPAAGDRASALAAAERMDLSGVSPSRRAETRRRIEIIRDHLLLDAPSHDDLAAAATAAGMTPPRLADMVRGWLLHRDAAALPGSVVRTTIPKRKSRPLSDGTEQAIEAALAELGTGCSSLALHRRATEICERGGHRPPSKVTAYYHLLRSREGRASLSPPSLAIDHVAIAMAVQGPHGGQLPVLSLAFDRPSGRIIAHTLSLEPPDARRAAELLLAAITQAPASPADATSETTRPLAISLPAGDDWDDLLEALLMAEIDLIGRNDRRLRAGRLATGEFGEFVAGLRMRPGHTARPGSAPLTRIPRPHAPLELTDARTAIQDAVARHNGGRPRAVGLVMEESRATDLSNALRAVCR